MARNIDKLIHYIEKAVQEHRLAPGCYARWRIPDAAGRRNMGSSEYGCADAANILYSIGRFPRDTAERAASVAGLRRFQHPDGCFAEPTHHTLHTTAHCIAALELFDAGPALPLTYHMEQFGTPEKLTAFLASLDWSGDPWDESHKGAGVYAAMALACEMPQAWHDAYFDWLAAHADPVTGVGAADAQDGQRTMLHHFAGWFHYMFNHVYARRPFPHAEKLVDTLLAYYDSGLMREAPDFGRSIGFAEIDWIFLVNRASMATGHRRKQVLEKLRQFAAGYLDWLEMELESEYASRFDDLHALFGTVCALAELQLALPGEIVTARPLKNVLDRRPFI